MPVRLNITIDEDMYERLKGELPRRASADSSARPCGPDCDQAETSWTAPTKRQPRNAGERLSPTTGAPSIPRTGRREPSATEGSIDKRRLKARVGTLTPAEMARIDDALAVTLGLP